MSCTHIRERLCQELDENRPLSAEIQEHLASCSSCAQFAHQLGTLDGLLTASDLETPGPGFDTRFFARLEKEKNKKARRKWWTWSSLATASLAGATAAVMALLWTPDAPASLSANQVELAMNLDLLENMDVIETLDEVEAYEVLSLLTDEELADALKKSGGRP